MTQWSCFHLLEIQVRWCKVGHTALIEDIVACVSLNASHVRNKNSRSFVTPIRNDTKLLVEKFLRAMVTCNLELAWNWT
jgi:hypothetical protein